jgi:hypothetical protein
MKSRLTLVLLFLIALSHALPLPPPFPASAPDCKNAPLLYPKDCGAATAPSSFTAEFQTTAGSFTVQAQVNRHVMPSGLVCALHTPTFFDASDTTIAAQMGPSRRR